LRTETIDVDGVSLRVRTAGLDTRRPDQVVVVFESGGGMPLETWDAILASVAKAAPVVAYDRSGTGKSAWDSQTPTLERTVTRLGRLLATLRVAPPYVLVGHSWGGALMRYFAGTRPADVRAIVYLDPTDITQSPADERALFESIGAGAAAFDEFYAFMERSAAGAPAAVRAEALSTLGIFRQEVADRGLPPVAPVPATVILAGKPPAVPQAGTPFDAAKYAHALYQLRLRRLRDWVRPPGEFTIAENAGHFVHVQQPDLVIEAIRRFIPAH
jgi:pimeloyl-ACP methyl ester carboxylesterase